MTDRTGADPEQQHAGHLFVVRADLLNLDCDAWLLPTDDAFMVEDPWASAIGLRGRGRLSDLEWKGRRLAMPVAGSTSRGGPWTPLPILGRVGVTAGTPVDQAVARAASVASDFVDVAVRELRRRTLGRRPRLALPLIGTGAGGLAGAPGDLLVPLIDSLEQAVRRHDVDVVLTVVDDLAWSAVQEARHRRHEPSDWMLTAELETLAHSLAEQARTGRLVLFVGAGVSRDAGLPDWNTLLDGIAAGLGVPPGVIEALRRLDPRDRAHLLEQRAGSRERFLEALRSALHSERFGLSHALLASLRAEAAVTTNFDDLLERAASMPGDTDVMSRLPYEPAAAGRPWLLKLHGDLDRGGIVITRGDYLGAARDRSALFGIVQALLVTRHLLFVGYSLSDEDFHQLVDEIGVALGGLGDHRLGTVLTVDDPPWRDVWSGSLDIVTPASDGGHAANAHQLQVLLDRVNHLAADRTAHLLDPRYAGLLTVGEAKVADHLRQLECLIRSGAADSTVLRSDLSKLLGSLGLRPEQPPSTAELRALHCYERIDAVPADPSMTAFRRRARLQQARWREANNYPIGHQPMRSRAGQSQRELGSRIEVDEAAANGWNLLTESARRAALDRIAHPQRHQTFDADRLWSDALSSMPLCFNVFGPLSEDHLAGRRVIEQFFPHLDGPVTDVFLEWSPARRDTAFLGDRTAFDAAIITELPDGGRGVLGVETKYHEYATVERAPIGAYRERLLAVHQRSGVFRPGALDGILGTDLQQIWRDHLLVLSMLQHPSGTWSRGQYALVYPARNVSFDCAARRYRALLDDQRSFVPLTLERLLDANGPLPGWLSDPIRNRYLW